MDDPSKLVPLPPSIDLLINKICKEKDQKPPSPKTREKLDSHGEEGALKILGKIIPKKIAKSLLAFINYLLKEDSPIHSPSFLPQKKPRLPISPQRKLSSSASTFVITHYLNPQGNVEAVAWSLLVEAPRDSREALWEALGGLEFRKQFLILVYSGGYCILFLVFVSLVGVFSSSITTFGFLFSFKCYSKDLGSTKSIDNIRNWEHLPMVEFERRLWEDIGRYCIKRNDRQQVDVRKQRYAFPPNFVHSVEGSHMMMTVLVYRDAGLRFAGVHDSLWTHACDVDQMNEILGEKFVEPYSIPILENLLESFQTSYPISVFCF